MSSRPAKAVSGNPPETALPSVHRSGSDAVKLLRAAVREPESRYSFVEDKWNAELIGQLPEALQELGLRRNQTLERLDDHPADLIMVLLYDPASRLQVVERRYQHLVLNRTRDSRRVGYRRRKLSRLRRPHAHESVVVHSVKAALELEYLVPPTIRPRRPHRVQRRLRSRRAEPHLVRARNGVHYLLGQEYRSLVLAEERNALGQLLAHRLNDLRVTVTHDHRPRPQKVVDVLVTAGVPDSASLPALDNDVVAQIAQAAAWKDGARPFDKMPLSFRL